MKHESQSKLIGILIVPLALIIILIPYSLLIGWNLMTLALFWFVITPGLAIYLPTLVSKRKNMLFESLMGLIAVYALMTFMIYDHYKSDYFKVMLASGIINMLLVFAFVRPRKSVPGVV